MQYFMFHNIIILYVLNGKSPEMLRLIHRIINFRIDMFRWRRLEGKDPETLELIHKINNLQKRLISKQELIIEKDMKFEEVDKVVHNILICFHFFEPVLRFTIVNTGFLCSALAR